MLRRAFLAAAALLLTGRLSSAQQRPTGEQTVPRVLNVQGLISRTLSIATTVEEGAEQMLRGAVAEAFGKIEVPNVALKDLPMSRFPDLFTGQGNLSVLLLTVLQTAKTKGGQIIVTRQVVEESLKEHCPLYPFC
ncbi:hypothetical protein [Bradyrhizobium sp. OK095]|jgi:hypothetical protein|uniref:hypothetical protein n=1 Tax=Bradyrhizobium sp. OK095 TaxID=1882760 RepID=UPI0008C8DD31|nr:hypothetical protein [Bradyrhizobium sp. OK095]SEN40999.1 hypothetical protein SAMN05443254_10897 [Bradyrhizobium sp. OK095]